MVIPEACPQCGATQFKKNGHTRHGKQNYQCKECERQFSAGANNRLISPERIENLLRERISLRGICRAVDVSPDVATALYGRVLCGVPGSPKCAASCQCQ